jgi:hypothetical protein
LIIIFSISSFLFSIFLFYNNISTLVKRVLILLNKKALVPAPPLARGGVKRVLNKIIVLAPQTRSQESAKSPFLAKEGLARLALDSPRRREVGWIKPKIEYIIISVCNPTPPIPPLSKGRGLITQN